MAGFDLVSLPRLLERLRRGPLPANQAFGYFVLVAGFDAYQLAALDASPHNPGPYTAPAVWASFVAGVSFMPATYWANGGALGVDYFARYFSLCGVVGLWTAGPMQLVLRLPSWIDGFSPGPLYAPLLVVGMNLSIFSIVTLAMRRVAEQTHWTLPVPENA